MKLTVILLLGSLVSISAPTYSQNTRLNVSFKNASLIDIFRNIEDQSEFYFYFNKEDLKSKEVVSVELKDVLINEVLDQVLINAGLEYKIIDRYVVVKEKGSADPAVAIQAIRKISGKVTDSSGATLPGASVVVKGTTTGVITDQDGKYSLGNIPENATIQFSFVGMKMQEVKVGNRTTVNMVLEEETIGIEEVVAIGYGTQKKVNLTGSISSIKADELQTIPTSNLSNALAGRITGLYITQSTGTPGVASDFAIRSVGSWNDSNPIYVIDGVVREKIDFDRLDANEVENINILKDAASAAIYGARSANGVVLVTTKSGKTGKPKISYSTIFSMEKVTMLPAMVEDAVTSALMGNEAIRNPNNINYWTPDELEWLGTQNGGKGYYWLDYAYRDPQSQKHSISLSGGTNNVRYYVGGSYLKELGFLDPVKFHKYNLRSNIEVDITKNLTARFQLSQNNSERGTYNWPIEDKKTLGNLWNKLYFWGYGIPPYIDGKPVNLDGWSGHPIEMMKENTSGYYKEMINSQDLLTSIDYKIPFIKGLSFNAKYSRGILNTFNKTYYKLYPVYNFERTGAHNHIITDNLIGESLIGISPRNYLDENDTKRISYQLNAGLSYNRKFGKHDVDGIFMYEQSEGMNYYFYGTVYDNPIIEKDQWFAFSSADEDSRAGGNESETGRLSYIGRINYNYAEKYLLTFSSRYDGSMKFAPDKRWGLFPAVSAGWRISEEPFFKDNVGFINYLKLRASAGMMGNDAVGGWQWQETYSAANGFMFGDNSSIKETNGIIYDGIPNSNLTWEKSITYNGGLDAKFLNDKLDLSTDIWFRKTWDILGPRNQSVPTTYGGILPDENYGQVNSHGFEVNLGYHNKIGSQFNYYVRGNFSYATNKVIIRDVADNIQDWQNPIGRPLGYIATVVYTDIIRTQEALDALPKGYRIFGKAPRLGMLNYEDVSGPNDVPNGIIDTYDNQVVSNHSTPPVTSGLTLGSGWNNFKLELFFQGMFGYKKFYNGDAHNIANTYRQRMFAMWEDRWTPDNPDGTMPALSLGNQDNYSNQSTFWLHDGSFVRLKNLMFSYDLPVTLTQKAGIDKINLFVNGTNLITWSVFNKNGYYDVELISAGTFPNMKVYSFGINVTL